MVVLQGDNISGDLESSINNASNATSLIATLVATIAFTGPLQPPLGWACDGYVYTNLISVRVYLVCNSLYILPALS